MNSIKQIVVTGMAMGENKLTDVQCSDGRFFQFVGTGPINLKVSEYVPKGDIAYKFINFQADEIRVSEIIDTLKKIEDIDLDQHLSFELNGHKIYFGSFCDIFPFITDNNEWKDGVYTQIDVFGKVEFDYDSQRWIDVETGMSSLSIQNGDFPCSECQGPAKITDVRSSGEYYVCTYCNHTTVVN